MNSSIRDLIKFRNIPIFWKISFMPILAVGLMMIGVFSYVLPLTKEKFIDDKRANASDVVSVAYTVVAEYDRRVAKGELTLEEAQERAKDSIRSIRFGKKREGYLWINDLEPKMLMHPIYPNLEGKNLSDFKDQNGKQFFMEMVKVSKEKGEGFVDYVWPKAEGEKPSPKISCVKLYKPWGWIIGSGIYVDDVMTTVWKICDRNRGIACCYFCCRNNDNLHCRRWLHIGTCKRIRAVDARLLIGHREGERRRERQAVGKIH